MALASPDPRDTTPAAGSPPPVDVVYVLGRGRSGSTVFAQALAATAGFLYAGEVRYLWDPALTHDAPCACGRPVTRCPLWGKVIARLAHLDRDAVVHAQHQVLREANLPKLLRAGPGHRWPELATYRAAMAEVYTAITQVSGCRVIVDSSKRPSYAMVVAGLATCRPSFIHLVRDPRASAYSWSTSRHQGGAGAPVRRRGAVDATLRWLLLNLGSEAVLRGRAPQRRMRLRYEDFVAAPRRTVEQIVSWVGQEPDPAAFVDDETVRIRASHALAGNPARERTGEIRLRDRGEWRTGQSAGDKLLASLVAAPLLHRYRYPLRVPGTVPTAAPTAGGPGGGSPGGGSGGAAPATPAGRRAPAVPAPRGGTPTPSPREDAGQS